MRHLLSRIGIPLLALFALAMAWRAYGWPGAAVMASAIVMWALLHFNRMLLALKRAADRPVGYVDSAVMLNARLKKGVSLLHVLAMTRALGALQTARGQQPEIYRWTDGTDSRVDCEFRDGRLVRWEMVRPSGPEPAARDGGAGAGGANS